MKPLLGAALSAATLGAGLAWSAGAYAQDCIPPRILFVIDASTSMNDFAGTETNAPTKWQATKDAIGAVLAAYPQQAQYGLMTFPGVAGGCATGEVLVDVGISTESQILGALDDVTVPIPGGRHTPAGQSLMAASQYGLITDGDYFNYVLFVNDGWQWCSVNGDTACVTSADCTLMDVTPCPTCLPDSNDGCYCVQGWPVLGATALFAEGVSTYVVGFGESVNYQALNRTANAGGTALPNCDPNAQSPSCYFQATLASELTAALGLIAQEVITEPCYADCDIPGTRTCTISGWSDCDAPTSIDCVSSCGTDGTQSCVNGALTECSSEAACGAGGSGTGNTGAGATGAGTPTGGTGTGWPTGGTGNSGNSGDDANDPEEEGNCGCRTVGATGASALAAWGLAVAGLCVARRRPRRRR